MDPVTTAGSLVAYFVTHYMDNVVAAEINNFGHHAVRQTLRAIDGDADERANHDIVRTVRLAQITALEAVLDGYARLNCDAWAHDDSAPVEFLNAAASFCREQRRLARTDPASLARPVLEPLQATVDGMLAPAVDGSSARAYADAIAAYAEDAVLDELRQHLNVAVPLDFPNYLKHGAKGDHPRFLTGFADEIREAVKSNPRYRDILLASGLAEIKAQGFEVAEILLRVEQRFKIDSAGLRAAMDQLGERSQRIDTTVQRTETKVDELAALVRHLIANNPTAGAPKPPSDLAEAVQGIASGAHQGDTRLALALNLLQAGQVDEAVPLLRAFADDKRARIAQDRREAATAYRNLGAIAGLRDPKSALDAYVMAAELDPDDGESLLWAGWLGMDRGELGVAETRLQRLLALTDEDGEWRFWARLGLGDVQQAQGDLAAALTSYQASLAIAERLAKADPGNAGWQHDLSVSYDRIGDVQQAQGDLAAALTSYRASLAIRERLAKADPGNAGWQRDLSVSHNNIGDVQAQGDLAAALTSYQASLAIAERLAKADPGNAGWQRDLSVSHEKIGDVQQAQGDLAAALTSYQASHAIFELLAKADRGNAGWQRDLSVSHNKIGDVRRAQGDLAAALTSYRDSLAIRERLAKADPGNAGWQRDLSVSHNKIGDVRRAQGDLAAALTSYQASLAIAERLAKADPGNAGWQRDLSVSHDRIGDVQQAQGDLAAALTSYQASLAIAERLAKADPGNAGWQRDLSVSHERIGDVQQAHGDLAAALTSYQASLAIRVRLAKADLGNAGWQRDLSVSHDKIGDVQAQGDLAAALTSYQVSLAIAERLAKADPGNAGWQRDLALSYGRVAMVVAKLDARDAAVCGLRQGREIITRLSHQQPTNVTLPRDLSWFDTQIANLDR